MVSEISAESIIDSDFETTNQAEDSLKVVSILLLKTREKTKNERFVCRSERSGIQSDDMSFQEQEKCWS